MIYFTIGLAAAGIIFGLLGRFVAGERGREPGEGFVLGFLFGPLGVLIELFLPAPPPKPVPRRRLAPRPAPPDEDDRLDEAAARWISESIKNGPGKG